jgi:hypothetical protein
MTSENTVKEPFASSDKQRLIDRIAELETENAHLKAENAGLIADITALHEQISKSESDPEFSEAFDEATGT